MANFLFAYKGGSQPQSQEEGEKVGQAWMAWFGTMGDAVVDGGNPCSNSATVNSDGSVSAAVASPVTGYSVVKADSLDAATAMAKGCPHLQSGGSVEVYETYNAMG